MERLVLLLGLLLAVLLAVLLVVLPMIIKRGLHMRILMSANATTLIVPATGIPSTSTARWLLWWWQLLSYMLRLLVRLLKMLVVVGWRLLVTLLLLLLLWQVRLVRLAVRRRLIVMLRLLRLKCTWTRSIASVARRSACVV